MFPTGVGQYTSYPPVSAQRSASRNHLFGLMRGAHSYANAAGGFPTVRAMPQLQHFKVPAPTHTMDQVRMVELYGQAPSLFRRRLENMFVTRKPPGKL